MSLADPFDAALDEVCRYLRAGRGRQVVTINSNFGVHVFTMPPLGVLFAEGDGTADNPGNAAPGSRDPLALTDADREVIAALLPIPRGQGMAVKQLAARLRLDFDATAKRLRRLRRRGLVQRVAGVGVFLTSAGRAAIATDATTGHDE